MAEKIDIFRTFNCAGNDLAVATYKVLTAEFGKNPFIGARPKFYKPRNAVALITVHTSFSETTKGIAGVFQIKSTPVLFSVNTEDSRLAAEMPPDWQARIEEIFDKIERQIKNHSVYKGKAMTIHDGLVEFMDLGGVDFDRLVYNKKVLRDLQAHIWGLIEHPDLCQNMNIKSQRRVLLSGFYGSGKTFAIFKTASIAIKNKWTFISIEPTSRKGSNDVEHVLRFARRYQPAVVSLEDFDREQRMDNPFALGNLMIAMDGILSKNDQLIILLTTNHPDKISGGFQRPGRISKNIDFNLFTAEDIQILLHKVIRTKYLDENIDWDVVAEACKGYTQAFIDEVGTGAKLLAIGENSSNPKVTQEMLTDVARDLRKQYDAGQSEMGFNTKK